ncbi:MAG: hypothetical protein U5N85_01730 [Arcicella sp.]|nr:hypothetical protein [Arcicella sp.]
MQTSQNRALQIILTTVGMIALLSRYFFKFQDIQLSENQHSIIRFIAFGCLAGANYLNYKKTISEGKTNSKFLLGLSVFLGLAALVALSRIFF